ncbi:hypothetical protein ACFLQU_01525 [Verrucomicrobiota bacterium]
MTDEPADKMQERRGINLSLNKEIPESVRKPFRKTLYDLILIIIIIIAGLASVLGGFLALQGLKG